MKTCYVEVCNENKVEVSRRKGDGRVEGDSAFKPHAEKYKSTSDSAHKVLIQFQRYFSFSS
jgi:hypothetical protein